MSFDSSALTLGLASGLPPVSSVSCVDLDYTDYFALVARAGGVLLVPADDWPRLEELQHRTAICHVMTGPASAQ